MRPQPSRSVADAEDQVAAAGRAGRPGTQTVAASPGAETGEAFHGGHSSRPRNEADYERQDRWANDAYDHIRQNHDADVIADRLRNVARVDGSTGFSAEEIGRIREHIFIEEHPLADYDGGIVHRRYDASPDMAEAWLRLRSGDARPEDIALLEHESAEARYYDIHPGSTYEEAHAAANEVSDWQNQIPAPTHEDYSKPWR